MNKDYILPFLIGIIISYPLFKLANNTTHKKEDFVDDIDKLTNKIKNETKDLIDNAVDLEDMFEKFVDEMKSLDNSLSDFFKEVDDLSGTLMEKIGKVIGKFFNQSIDKIFNPKIFSNVIKTLFSIIWKVVSSTYNIIYKKHPEVSYIMIGLLIFISMPIIQFFTVQISFLQLFFNPTLILGTYLVIFFFIYLNIWKIWSYVIDFVLKILLRIDIDDILIDLAKEIGDIFKDTVLDIFKF